MTPETNARIVVELKANDALEEVLLGFLTNRPEATGVLVMQALKTYYLPQVLVLHPNVLSPYELECEIFSSTQQLKGLMVLNGRFHRDFMESKGGRSTLTKRLVEAHRNN